MVTAYENSTGQTCSVDKKIFNCKYMVASLQELQMNQLCLSVRTQEDKIGEWHLLTERKRNCVLKFLTLHAQYMASYSGSLLM